MADTKKQVLIQVGLEDKASAALHKLGVGAEKVTSGLKTSFKAVSIAVAAVTASATAATYAFVKMSERVGKIEGLSLGFERNFGNMERSLQSFRKASSGMVSDMDLMQTANRAALLGVTKDVDKLSGLMITARLRGREMGMSMTDAFGDIVTGIGRGSPLILDNLGIKIPDALTKAMEKMSETEKMQTLLNFAIKDGATIAAEYGESIELTAGEKMAVLQASLVNIKDTIMGEFIPSLASAVYEGLVPFIEKIQWLVSEEGLKGLKSIVEEGIIPENFPFSENTAKNILEIRAFIMDTRDSAMALWDSIKTKALEVWGVLEDFWKTTLEPLFIFWKDMVEKHILPKWEELKGKVKELFDLWKEDLPFIKEVLKALAQIIGIMLVGAITIAIWVAGRLISAVTDVIQIFIDFKTKVDEKFDSVIDKLAKVVTKFRDIRDWVQKVIDKIKDIPSKIGISFGGDEKRATGGMTSGGLTMVGERGAELVSLPRGSHVYNSEDTKQMTGSGGITINVNAPVTGVDNLKAVILEAVNEATERQNRLANYNLL